MYFRIIVKNSGVFQLRSSKIHAVATLSNLLGLIASGADLRNEAGQEFTVEVLRVNDERVGEILSSAALDAILAEDDTPSPVPASADALSYEPINGTDN